MADDPKSPDAPLPVATVETTKDGVTVRGPMATVRCRWIGGDDDVDREGGSRRTGPLTGIFGVMAERIAAEAGVGVQKEEGGEKADVPVRRGTDDAQEATMTALETSGRILLPPISLRLLAGMRYQSSILGPVLDALATNVHGLGDDLEYVGPPPEQPEPEKKPKPAPPGTEPPEEAELDEEDDESEEVAPPETGEESEKAQAEKRALQALFATINPRRSFTSLRMMHGQDRHATGNAFAEIRRDARGGFLWDHLSTATMFLTRLDRAETMMTVRQWVPGSDADVPIERVVPIRFRRYVQVLEDGRKVWFKEVGDPRPVRWRDGAIMREGPEDVRAKADGFEQTARKAEGDGMARADVEALVQKANEMREKADLLEAELATECLHDAIYSPLSPYGIPNWIGVFPQILGERQAQQANEGFFSNNAIPRMAVLVSGGQLTDESFSQLKRAFQESGKSKNRFLLIEAIPHERMEGDKGSVAVSFKPLTEARITDAQFSNYIKMSVDAVRQVERIPPVFVGAAQDYSFASANVGKIVFEEQVCQPERREFDEMVNLQLLSTLDPPPRYWRYRSLGPEVADVPTYVAAVGAFLATGAMTLNEAIRLANEMLGTQQKPREEAWADWPWQMVMALLAQGKLADMDAITKEPEPFPPELLGAMAGRMGGGEDGEDDGKGNGTVPPGLPGKPPGAGVPEGEPRAGTATKSGAELMRLRAENALLRRAPTPMVPAAVPVPLDLSTLAEIVRGGGGFFSRRRRRR